MRTKVKERKYSRFSVSGVAVILFCLGAPFGYLSRSGAWLHWLEKELNQIGFGRFSYFGAASLTIAVACAFILPAARLATRSKLRLQLLRDAEANSAKINALYLRPFFTDTKTQIVSPFYSNWSMGISLEPPILGPEEFVGRVLEPYIDVCEVGGSPATIGIGRRELLSEETWKMAVIKAIRAASVIVILPSFNREKNDAQSLGTGTVWELKYLVNSKQIDRTIAVMPRVPWFKRRKAHRAWEQARVEVSQFGLVLPAYRKTAGVMIFEYANGAWQPKKIFGQGFRRKRLASGLVEALKEQAKQTHFELLTR